MDENKLHEAVNRGAQAAQQRDELRTAFEELKASYFTAWCQSEARDAEGRERLYHAVQILGKVEDHLRGVADGGKIAAREITEIERAKEAEGS